MDICGTGRLGLGAGIGLECGLKRLHRNLRGGVILGPGFQVNAILAFGGRGHSATAPDRDSTNNRADCIGNPGMFGQDHMGMHSLANCRIIARGRGAKPDHWHRKPGVQPQKPGVLIQPFLHQDMRRQLRRRQAKINILFGKSSL